MEQSCEASSDQEATAECNTALREYYAQLARMEEHNRRCIINTRAELRRKYGEDDSRQRRRRRRLQQLQLQQRQQDQQQQQTARSVSSGSMLIASTPEQLSSSTAVEDEQAMNEFLALCRRTLRSRRQQRKQETEAACKIAGST